MCGTFLRHVQVYKVLRVTPKKAAASVYPTNCDDMGTSLNRTPVPETSQTVMLHSGSAF